MTPIASACIVGSGVAGAMCALAIARRLPGVGVTLFDPGLPILSDALLGAARPSIRTFHDGVGLDENLVFARTQSGVHLGTEMDGLSARPWFRGYDEPGRGRAGVPFHQLWGRARREGICDFPYDAFSPAAALARAERFAAPSQRADSALANLDYGILLDLAGYGAGLRALATAAGALLRAGRIGRIISEPRIERVLALELADGYRLEADLWIDATGADALVRRTLPMRFTDWNKHLLVDRLLVASSPIRQAPSLAARLRADPHGYLLETENPAGCTAIVARQAASSARDRIDDVLEQARFSSISELPLTQGALADPWRGNCVAVGEAAITIDPLALSGMHLLCRQIDRLVAHWPDTGFDRSETALYNRRTTLEGERARDFVHAHYLLARHDGPAWKAARTPPPSAALAEDLALFGACGRLMLHDESPHDPEEWKSLFIGMGHLPKRPDALAAAFTSETVAGVVATERNRLTDAVGGAASHAAWLRAAARGFV